MKGGAGSLALLSPELCAKRQHEKMAMIKDIVRRAGSERNRAASTRGVRIMRENLLQQQAFGKRRGTAVANHEPERYASVSCERRSAQVSGYFCFHFKEKQYTRRAILLRVGQMRFCV